MKKVYYQNLWNFKLGSQESMNIPIWINIGFQQRKIQDSQNLVDDVFHRLPVTRAQCIFGTEKNQDAGKLLYCDVDDYSQGYGLIREAFRALTKMTSLNLIYHMMILELQTLGLMMLAKTYTFLVYDIRKLLQLLNQLWQSLNLMEISPMT